MNKLDAMSLSYGDTIYHKTETDSRGNPVRCRVNGKCKTWKTRGDEFRLPVKYGLNTCFYIDNNNSSDWIVS